MTENENAPMPSDDPTPSIPGTRPCIAHRRDGERCTQPAMRGQRVCKMHGGLAPAALAAARRRMAALIDPAIDNIADVLNSSAASDGDRLKAAFGALDRAGVPPARTIDAHVLGVNADREAAAALVDALERATAQRRGVREREDIVDADVIDDDGEPRPKLEGARLALFEKLSAVRDDERRRRGLEPLTGD